jgi:glyoxalase family protein
MQPNSSNQGALQMNKQILGIHHVTAICGHPQANLDFYAGLLGLKLVKLTVNFDDPRTYHLYYGDGAGTPGTILTFFPWPGSPKGRQATGQVTQTSFAVPDGSFDFWTKRLTDAGVRVTGPHARFDESVLSFHDPDGMVIGLVAQQAGTSRLDDRLYYANGPVPRQFAIHGFHSATLLEGAAWLETAELLTGTMGLEAAGEEGNRFRYRVPAGGTASIVDILISAEESRGRI